jgi:hypothetical protein
LIAYEVATQISAYHYNLGTYIRRNLYGTGLDVNGHPVAHLAGTLFSMLDNTLFKFAVKPSYVTKTMSFKFTPFNVFHKGEYDTSQVPTYTFGPIVSGKPSQVKNVGYGAMTSDDNTGEISAVISWDDLPVGEDIIEYLYNLHQTTDPYQEVNTGLVAGSPGKAAAIVLSPDEPVNPIAGATIWIKP